MSSRDKSPKHRRSREEIIDLFRACAAKLGRTPGMAEFERLCGITNTEVIYVFWMGQYTELATAAGLKPNILTPRLDDEQVFDDYAKICQRLRLIPNKLQLGGATREIGTKTHTVYSRYDGGIAEFQERFRRWLGTQPPEIRAITEFTGWHIPTGSQTIEDNSPRTRPEPWLHPFLPASLQFLDVLARGDRPPFDPGEQSVSTIFERRTADAFRCLGFEVTQLGQGTGRKADVLALV